MADKDDAANFATWPPKKSQAPPSSTPVVPAAAAAGAGGSGGVSADTAYAAPSNGARQPSAAVQFSDQPSEVVISKPLNPKTPLLSYADLQNSQAQSASDDDFGGGHNFMQFLTPRDEYNAAYATFVLLGVALLFPWNVVISASDYFNILYPGESIVFLFTICYMTTNFVGLIIVLNYGTQYSFQSRIVPGFIVYCICMLIIPYVEVKGWSLTIAGILGACDSVVQGSLFGLVGLFSPRYVSGFMAGQGVAGLSVALLRLFAKGVFPNDDQGIRHSGYLYFTLSVVVIVFAVIAYLRVLQRSPVTKHYLSKATTAEIKSAFSRFVTVPMSEHDARRAPKDIAHLSGDQSPAINGLGAGENAVTLTTILPQVWQMAVVVFLIFFVTLSLFPGITSELTSVRASLNDGEWFGIIMIGLFDAGDLIGRTIPNWPRFILRNERVITVLAVLRIVFLPLFIAAARHDTIFTNDFYPVVIMLGFAISNGYLGTVAMMAAVEKVTAKEKELTGTGMVFFLTIGLTTGVWTGYILNTVLHL